MADVKISALPASTTPLAGTEVLPIVQSSTTRQVSVANLTAGRAVSALSIATTTDATFATTSGSVGIGTSSVSATLEKVSIQSNSTPNLILRSTGNSSMRFYNSADNAANSCQLNYTSGTSFSIETIPALPITFLTTNAERMRIDSSGNVLVSVTSTAHTSAGFTIENAGIPYVTRGSGGTLMGFYTTTAASIGSITNSGGVAVLYNTTSDQRLKTNIVDAPSGNIDSIKVRSFDWIANGSHQKYGMVAQELIEVAPYAVNKPENLDEMMAVDYSKLVPMMIKEIQDLKQRITALENK